MMFTAADAFNAQLYGAPHIDTINYVKNQFKEVPVFISKLATNMYNSAMEIANKYTSSDLIDFISNVNRNIKQEMRNDNVIVAYSALEEFRTANLFMQRYIMANPVIRELFHKQQIDGYADTYIDIEPGSIGEDHYEWRRVMTGMMDENGICSTYVDKLRPEDKELTMQQQCDILDTWYWAEKLVLDSKNKELLTQVY